MRVARNYMRIVRFFGRPRVFDTTLVIVLPVPVLVGMIALLVQGETRATLTAGLQVVGSLCLLMRRGRPIWTAGLTAALGIVSIATQLLPVSSVTSLPSIVAYYSLGRYTTGRPTLITSATLFVVYVIAAELFHVAAGGWLWSLFAVSVPVGIGQFVRLRTELNERSRQETADAAVRAERRRIARELHDVVAHHITVINALVGGARATLPPGQEVTKDALESAEQTARQAMSEMRRLLDVLRADDNEGPDAATGVGAERLPVLIKEARSSGLPANLTVTGEPVELPAAVDHAVYRIVQEALTNTRKHAVSAKAGVRLAYEPAAVEVEVIDDGLARQTSTPGFGLVGMAERVALCGGRLSTGPRPEGGFRVHARIPLERS
ncbi:MULTISPECIES: sensor histidine kinase [Streptosporangium]|uniref:histidine kinase n=1 Tax=Streptosporangium brasiliense TaxID=47480 RepID=A0ABT9RJD9_9ACTN|nr:histidine kinase [Streptosporangium brasiliense]MDP9868942.1 signal transduction histidine kinase [Streptosporangium brasiliense]